MNQLLEIGVGFESPLFSAIGGFPLFVLIVNSKQNCHLYKGALLY